MYRTMKIIFLTFLLIYINHQQLWSHQNTICEIMRQNCGIFSNCIYPLIQRIIFVLIILMILRPPEQSSMALNLNDHSILTNGQKHKKNVVAKRFISFTVANCFCINHTNVHLKCYSCHP